MTSEEYADLLRKPQWQKMRLYVMESRCWACEKCGDSDNELHVHHTYYLRNRKPWEYPIDCFQCLCMKCHLKIHDRHEASDWWKVEQSNVDEVMSNLDRMWGCR